jgi:hypothetical protein
VCFKRIGGAEGNFSTSFDTLGQNPFTTGHGSLSATVHGQRVEYDLFGAAAGMAQNERGEPRPTVMLSVRLLDGNVVFATFQIEADLFASSKTLRFGDGMLGTLGSHDVVKNQGSMLGLIGPGTLIFETAAAGPGARVKGWFKGDVIAWPPWEPVDTVAQRDVGRLLGSALQRIRQCLICIAPSQASDARSR